VRGGKATTRSQVVTPLRQARLAIPATLEDVCADLDQHTVDGSAGVTPSMLSGWELGRHVTSTRYRKLLADYYGQPPEVLFAHQDASLVANAEETPRLLVGYRDLHKAMTAVVDGARRYLAVTGSRSRDTTYLAAIESALAARPELVHYRVLFGPPRHAVLTDHLLRLLDLRNPADRSLGKTLHIGMVVEDPGTPERFFCAAETSAVVPIPSLTSAEAFDSGVLLGPKAAERLIDHARQCYSAARRVETVQAIRALPVLRTPSSDPIQGGQV
jgi:transcriptional regulator with XRE-family HTH domain